MIVRRTSRSRRLPRIFLHAISGLEGRTLVNRNIRTCPWRATQSCLLLCSKSLVEKCVHNGAARKSAFQAITQRNKGIDPCQYAAFLNQRWVGNRNAVHLGLRRVANVTLGKTRYFHCPPLLKCSDADSANNRAQISSHHVSECLLSHQSGDAELEVVTSTRDLVCSSKLISPGHVRTDRRPRTQKKVAQNTNIVQIDPSRRLVVETRNGIAVDRCLPRQIGDPELPFAHQF